MRSFRKFLEEYGMRFNPSMAGGTQFSGNFDLPDLKNIHEPGEVPIGGFRNAAQATDAAIQRNKYYDKDEFLMLGTLEKLKALAENVYAILNFRNQGDQAPQNVKNYLKASYDHNTQTIHGLLEKEISGGEYPRLRNEEMQRGKELGIIFEEPNERGVYAISIQALRIQMQKYLKKSKWQHRAHRGAVGIAGGADSIMDIMATPGSLQRFHTLAV